MNRRTFNVLKNIDYTTLADIANREKENNGKRNVYYDVETREALVYPEDDIDGLKIRPLKNRLLKNGVRLNGEISKLIASGIEYSNNTDSETIINDTVTRINDREVKND